MGATQALKRIPRIKFPQRHPKPSGGLFFFSLFLFWKIYMWKVLNFANSLINTCVFVLCDWTILFVWLMGLVDFFYFWWFFFVVKYWDCSLRSSVRDFSSILCSNTLNLTFWAFFDVYIYEIIVCLVIIKPPLSFFCVFWRLLYWVLWINVMLNYGNSCL